MDTTVIQNLFIYPVKSMGPVTVDRLEFGEFGPRCDRQYMLVNEQGHFVTQRSHPVLSQFHLSRARSGWRVDFGDRSVLIADEDSTDKTVATRVWKHSVTAREKSREVSRWFSDCLDEWVVLVEMDDLEQRTIEINGHRSPLAFADEYPLLICNHQSLLSLQSELGEAISMCRFRPNIVIDLPAQSEYSLERLALSDHQYLQIAEPCVRCNIPAIDPATGVFSRQMQQRQSQFLKRGDRVIFGVNAGPVGLSGLSIGDQLTVIPATR